MDCMMAELKACESELYKSIAGILAISIGLKRSILREGSQKAMYYLELRRPNC